MVPTDSVCACSIFISGYLCLSIESLTGNYSSEPLEVVGVGRQAMVNALRMNLLYRHILK